MVSRLKPTCRLCHQTGETGAADHPNGYLRRPHASAPPRSGADVCRPRPARRRHGRGHPDPEDALPGRPVRPLPAGRRLVLAQRPRRSGPEAPLADGDGHRRLAAHDCPVGRQRRRLLRGQLHGVRPLVPEGLQGALQLGRVQVGTPIRVGQLPREGLAEREAARLSRRRLPAVRAAREVDQAGRRQPTRRARGQPPAEVRHPSATGAQQRGLRGRLVELQRPAARGLPAEGRHVRLQAGRLPASASLRALPRPCRRDRRRRERELPRTPGVDHGHVRKQRAALPRQAGAGTRRQRVPRAAPDRQAAAVVDRAPVPVHGAPAAARRRQGRAELHGPHGDPLAAGQPPRPGAAQRP